MGIFVNFMEMVIGFFLTPLRGHINIEVCNYVTAADLLTIFKICFSPLTGKVGNNLAADACCTPSQCKKSKIPKSDFQFHSQLHECAVDWVFPQHIYSIQTKWFLVVVSHFEGFYVPVPGLAVKQSDFY